MCQINDGQRQAKDTKDQGKNLQDQIKKNMDSLKSEKNKTKGLIQRVKDYLIGQCLDDGAGTWFSPGVPTFDQFTDEILYHWAQSNIPQL